MAYVSIATWRDLTNGHLYHEGEKFPFDGSRVASARLAELESGRNQAGLRLIRAIDAKAEPKDVQEPDAPEGATEAQETATEEKPGSADAGKPTKGRRAKKN